MKKITRAQMFRKINGLDEFTHKTKGVASWIGYIRDAYGMSFRQLAERMNLSKTAVHQLEQGEKSGSITLSSLKKVAESLNCKLVYALVPTKDIETLRQEQALKKANKILGISNIQMEMEDQGTSQQEKNEQIKILCEELLEKDRKLWD